jgi:hypothetical protein
VIPLAALGSAKARVVPKVPHQAVQRAAARATSMTRLSQRLDLIAAAR